jgi:uncharacterized protein (DUF1499 family)
MTKKNDTLTLGICCGRMNTSLQFHLELLYKEGMKRTVHILVFISLCFIVTGCSSMNNSNAGMQNGEFLSSPNTPNWVSSMVEDKVHAIAPIEYIGIDRQEAIKKILAILDKEERCRVITIKADYIHAEFRTKIFRFVDDVEFYFPPDREIIHIKSAARLGKGDLGVNRKRMELLREKFAAAAGQK